MFVLQELQLMAKMRYRKVIRFKKHLCVLMIVALFLAGKYYTQLEENGLHMYSFAPLMYKRLRETLRNSCNVH